MDTQRLIALLKQYPLVVVCLVLSLAAGLVIYFRGGEIQTLESQAEEAERDVLVMNRDINNARELEAQIETAKRLNEELTGRLIDRRDLTRNINLFYEQERRFELKMTGLSQIGGTSMASPPPYLPELKDFDIVRFSVTAEGSYSSIVRWLKFLEGSRYFIQIGELSISQLNDPTDRSKVRASVQIDMLGIRPPEPAK
ncbi:MAG: hypothetical protein Q7P63_17620 [Verrucomicrobiota bacterium JB022]|nr:hypothetical protein [Verrucomicrobiota bacterium JB022]